VNVQRRLFRAHVGWLRPNNRLTGAIRIRNDEQRIFAIAAMYPEIDQSLLAFPFGPIGPFAKAHHFGIGLQQHPLVECPAVVQA